MVFGLGGTRRGRAGTERRLCVHRRPGATAPTHIELVFGLSQLSRVWSFGPVEAAQTALWQNVPRERKRPKLSARAFRRAG